MAFKFRGKKKQGTALRLTGLFKTKTRGLYVGSVSDLDELKDKIRKAIAEDKGLVFFLWKNDPDSEGPPYTLSMDVSQDDPDYKPKKRRDDEERSKPKRRPEPEDDDSDDDESDEEEKDDEVPF